MVRVCVELIVHVCHMCGLSISAAYMWIKLRFKKKIVGAAYIQVCSIDRKLRYLINADLPVRLYLTVFVWKSTGSTGVRVYFSKYGQRFFRKYGNHDMNERKCVAREVNP